MGCSFTCLGSISRTRANATAPRSPPYDITNLSTLVNLYRRNSLTTAVNRITPESKLQLNYHNLDKICFHLLIE